VRGKKKSQKTEKFDGPGKFLMGNKSSKTWEKSAKKMPRPSTFDEEIEERGGPKRRGAQGLRKDPRKE